MNNAGYIVIQSYYVPAKLHSFSCILGHLLNIKAFQIIFLFELEKDHRTRMCFKLNDTILALM